MSIACKADQRFSYCLYVPPILAEKSRRKTAQLLTVVHGTERGNQAMRDIFIPLADKLGLIIVAPLFPAGIMDPYDRDNYKYIEYNGIRFDEILIAMLDEIAARYEVPIGQSSLFGFSGGAHFAHRFLYLHPERLNAVSICAPGSPTLLDDSQEWWVGVRDIERRFGRAIDLEAISRVAVHLAVGQDDLDTAEITHVEGSPYWMGGANDAGVTRVERLIALASNLEKNGIGVVMDILPGVRHERNPLGASAMAFFESVLCKSTPTATNNV